MKLSEALSKFLLAHRADGSSQQTVIWYRKRLSRFVEFFKDCDLSTITTDDLRGFVVSLQEQGVKWASHKYHKPVPGALSPSTIHGYVRCIKTLFNWLEDNEHITTAQNIAIRLKKPRLPKHAPKEITQSDLLTLLDASRSWGRSPKRNYAMLLFLAETGCRVAGLMSVRVDQLDLKKRRVMIVEKGNKTRWVFFGNETKKALESWLSVHPQNSDYLFVGERGRLTEWGVRMVLRHLADAAGVEGRVNPHSFRHAFAKRTLVKGGDVAFLSELMGHSDIKVTRDAYLIFRTEELEQAHKRFSSLDSVLRQNHPVKKIGQLARKGKRGQSKKPLK